MKTLFSHPSAIRMFITALPLMFAGYLNAQECNCDHIIKPDPELGPQFVDGNDFDIKPGQVICLEAGTYYSLEMKNFAGEPGNRITIQNCGGKASLSRLRLENSQHFRLTGTGVEGMRYGIFIDGRISDRTDGLSISIFSTDFEVDNLEFAHTKGAAFHMVMRPECDPATQRGNFVVENVDVHHNYVHDVGTEGFYMGHTSYYGTEIDCGGEKKEVFPVLLESIKVHDNIFRDTGWDAIQVSSAERLPGALIYNNRIYNYGTENIATQAAGIVIGGGSSARVYNNWIEKGGTGGIHVFGIGGVHIFNNLIKDAGGAGVFIGDKGVNPDLGMHVNNNTILNVAETGITVNNEVSTGNTFYNNIIINPGNYQKFNNKANAFIFFKNNDWDYDSAGNYTREKYDEVGFEDADNNNFYLREDSPARNSGQDLSGLGVTFDYNFFPRNADPGYSRGAFEYGSRPTVITGVADFADENNFNVSIYPNPHIKGDLTFDLELSKSNNVEATLVNASGSISIPIVKSQFLQAGSHSIVISEKEVDFDSMAKGIYYVIIKAGEQSETKRILLINEY